MQYKSLFGIIALITLGLVTVAWAAPVDAPSGLIVPAENIKGKYSLSWTGLDIKGVIYILQEATDRNDASGTWSTVYTGTKTKAKASGKLADQTYYYRVKSTMAGHDDSGWVYAADGCAVPILYTATGNSGGTISNGGTNMTVQPGQNRTLVVAPESGYSIASISIDKILQASVPAGSSATINIPVDITIAVKNKHKIKVKFEALSTNSEAYSTADLGGTWYLNGIYTPKNNMEGSHGYDIGTFTYKNDGNFTGVMTDEYGDSWNESGKSTVSADGDVKLWAGQGLNITAAMNAGKNLIIANYQDNNELDIDIFAKAGTNYSTADLEGTWYLRSMFTPKNQTYDNFGYDIGTFVYQSNGTFTGTMTDDQGSSWDENGTSTVNSNGSVNLWVGQGANFTAEMNSSKDVIIANYQDDDEYAFDVFVKKGDNYTNADLAGVWYLRGLCTKRNGLADNFSYDLGTFTYGSDGTFTGTMKDDEGTSWNESGKSNVSANGIVELWVGQGLNFTAAMNASKDVIIANYQDEDEFCFDIFVKKKD